MSDTGSESGDGENEVQKFKDAFTQDYSKRENIFCYTQIVYKYILNDIIFEYEKKFV